MLLAELQGGGGKRPLLGHIVAKAVIMFKIDRPELSSTYKRLNASLNFINQLQADFWRREFRTAGSWRESFR
jgi:hypothetical protein